MIIILRNYTFTFSYTFTFHFSFCIIFSCNNFENKQKRNFILTKMKAKITCKTLKTNTFSEIKRNLSSQAMNLGDEYHNILMFIALLIAGDEGWATKF